MAEEEDSVVEEDSPEERKRLNAWLIVALVAAVAAGVLLASSVWTNRWSDSSVPANAVAEKDDFDPKAWCAAQSTYDEIRRELFRRAAQVRGGDQPAYTRLADFALLRVNDPIVRDMNEQLQSVTCSGTANLDLPPGVAVAGGRRSLSGDLDYMVQPAADRTGNVVRIGNADSIVVPLATLARSGAPQNAPLFPPDLQEQMIEQQQQQQQAPVIDDEPAIQDERDEDVSAPTSANPSFDCRRARTRGERAVCGDPGLAALDRQMAAQFNSGMRNADREQRALLQRTRGRFLSYRDRCASNQCVAETYRSRMREISDIMANRWRG